MSDFPDHSVAAGPVDLSEERYAEARELYMNDPVFHSAVHHILAAEGDRELIAEQLYQLLSKWLPCEVCGGLIRRRQRSDTRAIHTSCMDQRAAERAGSSA